MNDRMYNGMPTPMRITGCEIIDHYVPRAYEGRIVDDHDLVGDTTTGLGHLLRVKRKELGLTQVQVAKQFGLSNVYLANIEEGKCNPASGKAYTKILEFLGITPQEYEELKSKIMED